MFACFRNFMLIIFVQMGPLSLKLALDGSGWSNEAIVSGVVFIFMYSKTISRLGFYSGN